MDAALVPSHHFVVEREQSSSADWNKDVFLAVWPWDQISIYNLGALRWGNEIARCHVQKVNETSVRNVRHLSRGKKILSTQMLDK